MARAKSWGIIAVVVVVSTFMLWMAAGTDVVKRNYDGPYYAVVAKSWYDKKIIGENFSFTLPLEYYAAHFPLYPAFMSLAGKMGYLNSGLIINLMATVATAVVFMEIVNKNRWGNGLVLALVWLFLWPRMWVVRSIVGPETLFIGLVIGAMYFFEKEKFWLAGVLGALATMTKSPGILLFPVFVIASRFKIKTWPTLLIPLALLGVFGFYYLRTGDFWAYFNSGDNIHLQTVPFRIFDSNQPWVGTFWLEDVLWIYLIGVIGVALAFKKSRVWGWFGAIYLSTIMFVSHRDVSRYSLPMVPVILVGLASVFEKKEVRWALALLIIPMFFYSWNFLVHNAAAISDWAPFFSR